MSLMRYYTIATLATLVGCAADGHKTADWGPDSDAGTDEVSEQGLALVVTPDPNDVGRLGAGYNSITNTMMPPCAVASMDEVPTGESGVKMDLLTTEDAVNSSLGVSASAKTTYGLFGGSARASFTKSAQSSAQSLSFVYRFAGTTKTQLLGANPTLTPAIPTVGQCGDQYLEQMNLGGELYILLKMDFATEFEKSTFAAAVGIGYGPTEVNGQIDRMRESLNGRVAIHMEAYLKGGDTSKLAYAMRSTAAMNAAGTAIKDCSIQNFQACRSFLDTAISYASGGKSTDFPQTLAAMPAHLSYTMKPWSHLNPEFPGAAPASDKVTAARDRIWSSYQTNVDVINRVEVLTQKGYFGAPATFQTMAKNMLRTAKSNIVKINRAVTACFDRLAIPSTAAQENACVTAANAALGAVSIEKLEVPLATTSGPASASVSARRKDYVASAYPSSGYWGDLLPWAMCPADQYAYGYEMRVEPYRSNQDDTGLNWVRMYCGDWHRTNVSVQMPEVDTTKYGYWGDWMGQGNCTRGPMHGMTLWLEDNLPAGEDDTSANDLIGTCTSGDTVKAGSSATGAGVRDPNMGIPGVPDSNTRYRFATTHPYEDACPGGTAICGFRIRVEERQPVTVDDTAMNGIELACCALPKKAGPPPVVLPKPARLLPIGHVDATTITGVSGWALDPDHAERPLTVQVYVDGTYMISGTANLPRPDVNQGTGHVGDHGFSIPVDIRSLGAGAHNVMVYAIDLDGLGNPTLPPSNASAGTVTVTDSAPYGWLDESSTGEIRGWAVDPDYAGPITVHIYVDGNSVAVPANVYRSDVGAHGFSWVPPAVPTTQGHTVAAYAIGVDSSGRVSNVNPPLSGSPRLLYDYVKPGNNGTVTCNTFCEGAQWGEVGGCIAGARTDIYQRLSCFDRPGLIPNNGGIACECERGFIKPGNNGTVSCNTFCDGAQWGRVGRCVGAVRGDSGARIGCAETPGLLWFSSELTCQCVDKLYIQ